MPDPRTVLVVNPHSQNGSIGRRWPGLAASVREAFAFEAVLTAAPGDATRLTREALRGGAGRIVAVGGDGTINEVVNGFFDDGGGPLAPGAEFGFLPVGTGSDFRRSFDLPADFSSVARMIHAGPSRRIDLGRALFHDASGRPGARMFANVASFGISGVVARRVNASRKRFGAASFFLATARAMLSYRNRRVRLTFDGDEAGAVEPRINTVAIANARFFGGAMMIAPDARMDDGQFDVITLGNFGFADLITSGRRLYRGTHLEMVRVSSRRAATLAATSADDAIVELELDGESVGRLPARFEIVPSALAVIGARPLPLQRPAPLR